MNESANDSPYMLIEQCDTVVVRFNEIVDHRYEFWEKQLVDVINRKLTVVWDLRQTEDIDSEWLRLLDNLQNTGRHQGKFIFTLGMRHETRTSADVLGCKFEHITEFTEAFADPWFYICLSEVLKMPELVKEFDRLHGTNLCGRGSTIELMIDKTTGKLQNDINQFMQFVHDYIYKLVPIHPE